MFFQQLPKTFPAHAVSRAGTTVEPTPPTLLDPFKILREAATISGDPVIAVMPTQFCANHSVLRLQVIMSMLFGPLRKPLEGAFETRPSSLAPHHIPSLAGFSPVGGKSQKLEGLRFQRGPSESNQTSLLRMQTQAVFAKPFWKRIHHSASVLFQLEAHDHVVRIADHAGAASQPTLHHFREPLIQRFMEKDIAQQRRNHSAYTTDNLADWFR